MKPETAWVKPPQAITGRDHLGARVPCEALYAKLLPGITNVTNRARCYSFYPWVIWALANRYQPLSSAAFVEKLRRADCLFTLIGAWHSQEARSEWRHGGELVGRDVLLRVLNELERKGCRLSQYTHLDNKAGRYFMNPLGGLGQYYLGSLRELGVLERDGNALVQYTKERGAVLAEAFDNGVNRERFCAALEADTVTNDTLASLAAFCPCHLSMNTAEQQALLNLFFNRPGPFFEEDGQPRRHSLTLLLDLIAGLQDLSDRTELREADEYLLRICAYTRAWPDGRPWAVSRALEPIQEGWEIYQRNELLSVAMQGIFWAALMEFEEQGGLIENRQAFRARFVEIFVNEALEGAGEESFVAATHRARSQLPRLPDWANESHELQLAWRLVEASRTDAGREARGEVVRLSIAVLVALAARDVCADDPYMGILEADELVGYPINLFTFYAHARQTWQGMSLPEWLGWLVTEWGLDVHFRIALRKLRAGSGEKGESKDTFRIRPTDEGLEVVAAPWPEFSNPRLRQALHILCDLGALTRDDETHQFALTEQGRSLLEECRG